MSIIVTRNAWNKMRNILSKATNQEGFLFSAKGGGCNGFNYMLEPYKEKIEKKDEIIKYENINIVICSSSIFHLLGTKIDWKEDIMGKSFHFENPNATSKCGCGTSFSIK